MASAARPPVRSRTAASFLHPFQLNAKEFLHSQTYVAAQGLDGIAHGIRIPAGLAVRTSAAMGRSVSCPGFVLTFGLTPESIPADAAASGAEGHGAWIGHFQFKQLAAHIRLHFFQNSKTLRLRNTAGQMDFAGYDQET